MSDDKDDELDLLSSFDRTSISKAIHRSAPLECSKVGRASKVIVAYPTLKERFIKSLVDSNEDISALIKDLGTPYTIDKDRCRSGRYNWIENKNSKELDKKFSKALFDAYKIDSSWYLEEAKKLAGQVSTMMTNKNGYRKYINSTLSDDKKIKSFDMFSPDLADNYRIRWRWEGFSNNHSIQIIEDYRDSASQYVDEFLGSGGKDSKVLKFTKFKIDSFTTLADQYDSIDSAQSSSKSEDSWSNDKDSELAYPQRGLARDKLMTMLGKVDIGHRLPSELEIAAANQGGILNTADYSIIPIEVLLWKIIDPEDIHSGKCELINSIKDGAYSPKPGNNELVYWIRYISNLIRVYAQYVCNGTTDIELALGLEFKLEDTPKLESKHIKVCEQVMKYIARRMGNWLRIDPKDHGKFREDFVISFISDGREMLISDLRPDLDNTLKRQYTNGQTNTFIIGLSDWREERGRTLQRLMDIAAFRHLSLRGFSLVSPSLDALTSIGTTLIELNIDSDLDDNDRKTLHKELKMVRKLNKSVESLNFFFTYGVNGKCNSTVDYSIRIQENLDLLREHRIPGFQTLSGYMRRYFSAVRKFQQLQSRFNDVKGRIDEASNLIRTRYDQALNATNRKYGVWGTVLACALAPITFVSLVVALLNDLGFDTNRYSDKGTHQHTETAPQPPVQAGSMNQGPEYQGATTESLPSSPTAENGADNIQVQIPVEGEQIE